MNKASTTTMVLNSSIVEYDIKQGNTSILEYYKLLPQKMIDTIRSYPDDKRKVAVGLLAQKNKELAKAIENGYTDIMKKFLEANKLDIDMDVLCINKDACFVIAKTPKICEFGPVLFRPKSSYHSYIRLGRLEFFVGNTTTDVKGLQKHQELHRNGVIQLIEDVVDTAIKCNGDSRTIYTYLSDLAESYKNKELDFEYYREFNANSKFLVRIDDKEFYFDDISEEHIENLDVSYNYVNVILPLIRVFV